MNPSPGPDAQTLVAAGRAALMTDNPSARGLLERAVEADPGHEPAYTLLVRACLAEGDLRAARAYADEAVKRFPTSAESVESRGETALAVGDFAGARADAEAAARLSPARASARMLRGAALLGEGRSAPAVAAYGEALERAPDDVDVLLGLGAACQRQGDTARARELFVRAGELAPLYWPVYLALAGLELLRDRGDPGIVYTDLCTELGGDQPILRALRAVFLARLGRLDEARADFLVAAAANPSDAFSRISLAEMEARDPAGREVARALAEAALRLSSPGGVQRRAQHLLEQLSPAGGPP